MYSVYSFPNTVICFFGGYIQDRWLGVRMVRYCSLRRLYCSHCPIQEYPYLCFVINYITTSHYFEKGAIIFSGLILLGQSIVAIGATAGSFNTMLLGRVVYGLGGENLSISQNTYGVKWFQGKELNMVFGFMLSFSRLGSTLNLMLMPGMIAMMITTPHVCWHSFSRVCALSLFHYNCVV